MHVPASSERSSSSWLAIVFTALVLTAVGGYFLAPGSAETSWLARTSYDASYRLSPGLGAPTNLPVVMVYLDRDSYLREGRDPQELWDRNLHAALIRRLTTAGARAIVFDVVFADAGEDVRANRELAAAIQASGRVILAAELNDWRRQTQETVHITALSPILPYEPFRAVAAGWGLASLRVDDDYTVRRFFPGYLARQQPSLTWATAEFLKLPITHEAEAGARWLHYLGPPLTLPNVNYSAALRPEEVPDSFFRDRVVVIGARPMVSGFPDRRDEYRSPWPSPGRGTVFMPAAEVQGTQLLNLVRHDFLKRPGGWTELGGVFVLSLAFPTLLFRFRPLPAAGAALLLEVGLVAGVTVAWRWGWWIPWLIPAVVQIPGALAGAVLFRSVEWYRQRRRLESARREAEAKIREQAALLDKAQDAILVRDLQGRVSYVNAAAERLFGWPAADWRDGVAATAVFAPSLSALTEAETRSARDGEWSGELELATRDGDRRMVQSRWTLIRDSQGQPSARLLINTDITEKKRLEAQFLRSQRMETIGTLAGGMAHDLNNALAPVLMGIQLIRRESTDLETQRLLAVMEANTYRGADMVRQVLLFSRGTTDERQQVDLAALLREVERLIRHSFPPAVSISLLMPRDLWPIWGNPTQLHQVLLNLCVNARDALPRGGELSLSADNVHLEAAEAATLAAGRPGDFVMLLVADTGEGISPEHLPRLFEPFFTTKPTGKGTGLGLATVARIVTAHGGFWNVRSEVGVGTTFEIYLPRSVAQPTPAPGPVEIDAPRGAGEGVLILEDDRAVAELLTQSLQDHGYRPLTATNRVEALALVEAQGSSIRALIVDASLADAAHPETPSLRDALPGVVVLLMVQSEIAGGSSVSGESVLVKPFGLPDLFKRLGRGLGRS